MKSLMTAIAAVLIATTAHAQEIFPVRTISVTGQAERKVVPNEAHLQVNLNAQELKLTDAKRAHDAKLNKLMALVRGAGIEEKKVRTDASNTQPIYTYETEPTTGQSKRIFKGYRVQSMLDITVADTSKLADLMDQITAAGFEKGANTEWGNLLNMYYTVSNPEVIRDDIMIEAIANAKQKAERMATAAGAALKRVHSISESGAVHFPRYPVPMMAMAKGVAMDAAEAAAPPAGEQELNATVTVVYELQ